LRHERRTGLTTFKDIIQNGQVVLPQPTNLPDGTEVELLPLGWGAGSSHVMHADSNLLSDDSVRAVESLAEAFDARSIRYAFIGGLAFVLRGRPRFTQDADFLLEVPQIVLPGLLDDLYLADPMPVFQMLGQSIRL
jgi:hypothetical protein